MVPEKVPLLTFLPPPWPLPELPHVPLYFSVTEPVILSSLNGNVPMLTEPSRLAAISVIGTFSDPVDCSVPFGSHLKIASLALSSGTPASFSDLQETASLVFATTWTLPPVIAGSARLATSGQSPAAAASRRRGARCRPPTAPRTPRIG